MFLKNKNIHKFAFLSLVLILLIFTRFFLRIKIIEIETSNSHYASTMEIFKQNKIIFMEITFI